jgi:hypothetical protein
MISWLYIIALGLVLGMRHATDPDHVIAVTTIVSRQRSLKGAALIGTFWGIGHTLTMLLVGGAIVLLGWVVPPRMGLWMEFAVALMLVLLGALNLTGILRWFTEKMSGIEHGLFAHGAAHAKRNTESGEAICEESAHGPQATHEARLLTAHSHGSPTSGQPSKMGLYQTVRPFVVGIVHGLAGSAAIALLVLATIRDPRWAIAYLLVFGGGTIVGMILITAAIAAPISYAHRLSKKTNSSFQFASGVISLAFGLFLAYQIVFVSGLFTGHPQWTPR